MRGKYGSDMYPLNQLAVTVEEAQQLPSFFRVYRVNKTEYSCPDCRECLKETWVNGSACDAHKVTEFGPTAKVPDCVLAVKVLRAGGNPEPKYTSGVAAAQWAYKRPGRKADREALIRAITRPDVNVEQMGVAA